MLYVANSFSLNMLPPGVRARGAVNVMTISREEAAALLSNDDRSWVSTVGHASTAALFSAELGRSIGMARRMIALTSEDEILVGQYIGPRLEEGTTVLPEGARIEWMLVSTWPGDVMRTLEEGRPYGGYKVAGAWRWGIVNAEPRFTFATRDAVVVGEYASRFDQETMPRSTVIGVSWDPDLRVWFCGGREFATLEEACAYADQLARADHWDVPEDQRPPLRPGESA